MPAKELPKVVCDRCGLEYQVGAPHVMFCRGRVPDDAACEVCGDDDHDNLSECSCGAIVCDCCKESGEHIC